MAFRKVYSQVSQSLSNEVLGSVGKECKVGCCLLLHPFTNDSIISVSGGDADLNKVKRVVSVQDICRIKIPVHSFWIALGCTNHQA